MAAVFLAHDLQLNRRVAIKGGVPRGMSTRTATVVSVGVVLVVTALSLRGGTGRGKAPRADGDAEEALERLQQRTTDFHG